MKALGPLFWMALVLALLSACSWRQAYDTARAWQRNECGKITDAQERSRCFADASTSYEAYRRQQEAAAEAR